MPNFPGITTDVVSSTIFAKMRFPCLVIDKELQISKSSAIIVNNLVTAKVSQGSEDSKKPSRADEVKDIAVYLTGEDSQLKLLGLVSNLGYGSLLEILPNEFLSAYLDKDTKLTGNNLLVLR